MLGLDVGGAGKLQGFGLRVQGIPIGLIVILTP